MSKINDFSGGMFCHTQLNASTYWSSWDFLSPLIFQKIIEDNISQLGDYGAHSVQQYTHGVLLYLFLQIRIIWSVQYPQTAQIFDIYLVVVL